ncbi:unnamed protein product [Clonostachys rosea f. rosea IK726]|uniref:Uncharacterized protein n=1 Tax=Clonostachys rosea f. rosea IK726 TaxID=1349383 RepID=A0ACA9TYP3_BIOOC|nr:unnamed protein product [Clonostachys rosea f. rosea IK726]
MPIQPRTAIVASTVSQQPRQKKYSSLVAGGGGNVGSRPILEDINSFLHGPFFLAIIGSDWVALGDGHHPICRECKRRSVECSWGLKVSFHPSRTLQLSSEHTAALSRLDKQRGKIQTEWSDCGRHEVAPLVVRLFPPPLAWTITNWYLHFKIIDDTQEIVRSFGKDDEASLEEESGSDTSSRPPPTEPGECDSTAILDDVIPYGVSAGSGREGGQTEDISPVSISTDVGALRAQRAQNRVFDLFNTLPPNLSPPNITTPSLIPDFWDNDLPNAPFFLGHAISRGASPDPEPRFPVSQTVKADLMSAYIQETATWCETTDSDMHFSVRSVHDMMGSKPFVAAAMSLASRQRDAVQGRRRHLTLELYQYTIRLLLGQDPTKPDASILATCTILCAYEMMASSVSEWRRHLRGCAELLRMCKWNGNSEGIVKSCFWAFARIDVWAAFILNQTTLIPTDSWVNQDSLVLVAAAGETDDYCNLAILIFARIINVLNDKGGARRQSQTKLRDNVQNLWDELQLWRRWRLPSVKPLMRIDQSDKSPFPTIMFALSSSICGNTFYHAGSILLLQSGLVNPDPSPEMAKAVIHIGMLGNWEVSRSAIRPSKPTPLPTLSFGLNFLNVDMKFSANWVNHLQPLYIAGTALDAVPKKALSGQWRPVDAGTAEEADDPTDMDFAAEKVALLRHLAKIERETGWKTKERARDLRVLWGLEN